MPEIKNIEDLSKITGLASNSISSLIYEESGRYRKHYITKKSGGLREISAPLPNLLLIQKAINRHLLSKVEIHKSAVGFREDHSIVDHVKPHLGQRKFAKFDVKSCFDSIGYASVFNVYNKITKDKSFCFALTKLSVHEGKIPMGAATSPSLCNVVLKSMDERIFGICESLDLNYTRYADDILVSGDKLNLSLFHKIIKYMEECGFKTNEKSRFIENPQRLVVCGLSISGDKIRVPKHKKREWRKETHFVVKNSVELESSLSGYIDPFYIDRLLGRLNFWRFAEPDAEFPRVNIPLVRKMIAHLMTGQAPNQ